MCGTPVDKDATQRRVKKYGTNEYGPSNLVKRGKIDVQSWEKLPEMDNVTGTLRSSRFGIHLRSSIRSPQDLRFGEF
jgi:hypothetical protein